jgi:diacylglycerol kinase (ATP)
MLETDKVRMNTSEENSSSSHLRSDARRVLVVVNASAGSGKRHRAVQHLLTELPRHGLEVETIDSLAALSAVAEQEFAGGALRAVVAAGGDGTVNEIINRTTAEIPVAVFPLGTENLLAKYFGITSEPSSFAEMIARGRTVQIDAGRGNGRLFLLMASVGFDAEVVRSLHAARDGNISHLSYAKPIWRAIRSYEYPELRIDIGARQVACRWAFVFNVPKYGGGLKFLPDALPTDGELDLCTFEKGGLISGLRYLMAVVAGRHRKLADCTTWRGGRLTISSRASVPYELDGDPAGVLPLTLDVVPNRVRMLVPE